MVKYVKYSELTEKEKEDMRCRNRKVLEDINDYLKTHVNVTYGKLYELLGMQCPKDMFDRLIDRWPD